MNNAKKLGEPILYSDLIHLQNTKNNNYWLNIDNSLESIVHFDRGLEVNASEDKVSLKLSNYMDFQNVKEKLNNEVFKTKNVQNGDIIIL